MEVAAVATVGERLDTHAATSNLTASDPGIHPAPRVMAQVVGRAAESVTGTLASSDRLYHPARGAAAGAGPLVCTARAAGPADPVPGRPDLVAHHAPTCSPCGRRGRRSAGRHRRSPFGRPSGRRASCWPASCRLSAWVRGQMVLDLGCGSGVAGIAALDAGATRVVAHDIDPVALAIAAQNARANAVELLLQDVPLLHAPCPRVSPVSSSGTSSWLRRAHRAMSQLCSHRRGPVSHRGRVRPFAPAGVRCLREERLATAWAQGGHACGRCGSSPWMSETAQDVTRRGTPARCRR